MKRTVILVLSVALLATVAVGASVAGEHELPDHPHMMVHQPEFEVVDGNLFVVGWRRCVDLAAGRSVPLHSHHAHLHVGTAGGALTHNAGIDVVPGAPLTPWLNCAELAAALPIFLGPAD